ncbi:MAG: hypothetical protein FGM37_08525 [Phycisphaerales bacterium]|nr:hypothetical protein [Phycisphaerales bacterium]
MVRRHDAHALRGIVVGGAGEVPHELAGAHRADCRAAHLVLHRGLEPRPRDLRRDLAGGPAAADGRSRAAGPCAVVARACGRVRASADPRGGGALSWHGRARDRRRHTRAGGTAGEFRHARPVHSSGTVAAGVGGRHGARRVLCGWRRHLDRRAHPSAHARRRAPGAGGRGRGGERTAGPRGACARRAACRRCGARGHGPASRRPRGLRVWPCGCAVDRRVAAGRHPCACGVAAPRIMRGGPLRRAGNCGAGDSPRRLGRRRNPMTAPADPNTVYLFVSLGLLGLAVVLLALELLIPSGGALAVATGVSAIASVVAMFAYDLTWGAVYLALVCIAAPVVSMAILKLWVNTPVGRRMVLSDETRDAGTQGISVGDEGTTLTVLRPVGTVRIGQVRVDGLAESGFIDAGRRVVVTELIDGNAKVREVGSATG